MTVNSFSLTATELPRFIACNGSLKLPYFESSIARDESERELGNAAHWLIQQVHSGKHSLDELVDRKADNGVLITSEMIEHVTPFLEAIGNRGQVELDVSYDNIRARLDHGELLDNLVIIRDFKYGWGIVEPENNWTLISYAIGFIKQLKNIPWGLKIRFEIYQPRPYHKDGRIRSWEIDYAKLEELYHIIASNFTNPSDMLNTGEHCKNCPKITGCPAARRSRLLAIDVSENAYEEQIPNEELSFVLDQYKRAIETLTAGYKAYSELAMHKVKTGETVTNYSIENELTNRQWRGYVKPETIIAFTGIDATKKELVTPAQAEKMGINKELVDSLCERRKKGIKLVRVDVNEKAKKLFNKE